MSFLKNTPPCVNSRLNKKSRLKTFKMIYLKRFTCLALFGHLLRLTRCTFVVVLLFLQNLLQGAELPVPCYRTGISFLFQMPVQSCHDNFETVGLLVYFLFLFESLCRSARACLLRLTGSLLSVCAEIPSYVLRFFQAATQNDVGLTFLFLIF